MTHSVVGSTRTFQTLAFEKSRLYLGNFLTTGVNFINILRACFSYESKLSSFSLIMFGFVIFGGKILYKKLARKILMKLTTGDTRFCGFVGRKMGKNRKYQVKNTILY
jgi:hypothetical protein